MCNRVVSEDSFLIVYIFLIVYCPAQYENILYFIEDSGNVVFSCNEIGILHIDLNNINLDNNFDQDDPDAITSIILLAWHAFGLA